MKAGTLFVALVVAGACIAGIVWLAGGSGPSVAQPSSGQTGSSEALAISETGPYPKVVMPEMTYDFGVMGTDQEKAHSFVLKNEGESELQYKLKGISCTCTVSDMEKGKVYTVPPGEQAEVELKWTPTAPELDFVKSADIYTNDPEHPIVTFTVSGRVEEMLVISPDHGWTLQDVQRNKTETVTAEITSAVLDQFEITQVDVSSDNVQAKAEPLPKSELGSDRIKSGYRVTVTFDPKDLKLGKISEKVTVHTDIDLHKTIEFPLLGQYLGPITGMPYVPKGESADGRNWNTESLGLYLGAFDASKGRKGWYQLLIGGLSKDETFEVTDIESSHEFITATVEELPPANTRRCILVTFEVQPGIRPGGYSSKDVQVVLKTNHPDAPEVRFGIGFKAINR